MSDETPLSAEQCRAARGLLGMSQQALADTAGVGLSTVRDLETERRLVSQGSLQAIRSALEGAGAQIIDENGGGAGVRLRKPKARR